MAEAVLRHVAGQLDVALSSGHGILEQSISSSLDRLIVQIQRHEFIVSPEVVHDTQITLKLGALLGRILQQLNDPGAGWQNVSYCKLVGKAARVLPIVFVMPGSTLEAAFCKQDPVIAQQLAASGLLPELFAALPRLTAAVEAADVLQDCVGAALAVLTAVFDIFGVWPGEAGVFSSKAAGPLVQPALRLILALFRHAVAFNDADVFDVVAGGTIMGITNLAQQVLVQTNRSTKNQQQQQQQQQHQQQQDHPYLKDLHHSPAFLALLQTTSCIILYSSLAAAPPVDAEPDRTAPAEQRDTVGSTGQIAEAMGDTAPVSAESQQQAELCLKLAQLLQDLHRHPGTVGSWQMLMSGSVVVTKAGQSGAGIPLLRTVLSAAAGSVQRITTELQQVAACSNAPSSSKQRDLSAQQQQFLETHAPCLHALRHLPVLLLRGLCCSEEAAPEESTEVGHVYKAAGTFISKVVDCWGLQLKLQSSCVGIQLEQLPSAELLGLLLQHIKVLQLASEVAAALAAPQSTAATGGARSSSAAVALLLAAAADAALLAAAQSTAATGGARRSSATSTAAADEAAQSPAATGSASSSPDMSPAAACAAFTAVLGAESLAGMVEQLHLLTMLQTVSKYEVWRPHVIDIAAAVEHCLRCDSISSSSDHAAAVRHRKLLVACDSLMQHNSRSYAFAGSDSQVKEDVPGTLLRAAAAAAPGSQEQQQLFTLLISLLKNISSWQLSGPGAREDLQHSHMVMVMGLHWVVTHMLDTVGSSNSDRTSSAAPPLPHGMPRSKLLCAAAPWLVASSRLVCQTTAQLAKCLEVVLGQQHASPVDGSSSSSSSNISSSAGTQSVPGTRSAADLPDESLRLVLHSNDRMNASAYILTTILSDFKERTSQVGSPSSSSSSTSGVCIPTDAGSSCTGGHKDVGAARDVDTSATAVGTVAAAVHDKVQDLQRLLLQEALTILESDESATAFSELHRVCREASPQWQLETAAGQHYPWVIDPPLAVPLAGAIPAVHDVGSFKHVVELLEVRQFLQKLADASQRVCAALPLRFCCNNPTCSNVSSSSEWDLVSGKGCVCAGCETARYCGRECQAAHWPWHKAICKAIKKKNAVAK